jgi:hypothetical protein
MNDESPKPKIKIKPRKTTPVKSLPKHQERYRFKPGFADKVRSRSLKDYRAERGKDFELSGATVLRSLDFVEDHAESLTIRDERTGKLRIARVVRPTVLAKLLDTSYQTIWRWSSETGQIPEPILTEVSQGRERPVYHVEECRVMIRAIGEHLNGFKYYRKDHTGTRDRIFHGIEELRLNNYGVIPNGNLESSRKNPRAEGKPGKVVGKIRRPGK